MQKNCGKSMKKMAKGKGKAYKEGGKVKVDPYAERTGNPVPTPTKKPKK
jgi:hypothetical protein